MQVSYALTMKFWVSILMLTSFQAFAMETDNYIVWDKELKDSTDIINDYLRTEIQSVLDKYPNDSCLNLTRKISKVFESHFVHDNPVENYLFSHLDHTEIYPQTIYYVSQSIYRDPLMFYIPKFGLAPNIQVNGYYFGTDKLSHFVSVGYIYFSKFLRHQKEDDGIKYGIQDEKSVHGYWASGVFSFADLEANYQGLQFFKNLCYSSKSILEKNSQGKWQFKHFPQIQMYVNGFWDESFNLSYRIATNWEKVVPALKKYCSKRKTKTVIERMNYYLKTSIPSYSVNFLRNDTRVPKAQSFDELCR